jgi:hypothetical protein
MTIRNAITAELLWGSLWRAGLYGVLLGGHLAMSAGWSLSRYREPGTTLRSMSCSASKNTRSVSRELRTRIYKWL